MAILRTSQRQRTTPPSDVCKNDLDGMNNDINSTYYVSKPQQDKCQRHSCYDFEDLYPNDNVSVPPHLLRNMNNFKSFNGDAKRLRYFFMELEAAIESSISHEQKLDKPKFDKFRALCLRNHLSGHALEFIRSQPSDVRNSYIKSKAALKQRFSKPLPSELIFNKLISIQQGQLSVLGLRDKFIYWVDRYLETDEVTQLYCCRQRRVMKEFLLHLYFLRALRPEIYTPIVMEGKPKTFDLAVKKALKVEAALTSIEVHKFLYNQQSADGKGRNNLQCKPDNFINRQPTYDSRVPVAEHVYNVPPLSTVNVNVRKAGKSSHQVITSRKIDVSRPPPKIVSIKYVPLQGLSKNYSSRNYLKSPRLLTLPLHSQSPKPNHNKQTISYPVASIGLNKTGNTYGKNKLAFSNKEQPRTLETCQTVNPGCGLSVKCSNPYESQLSNEMPGGDSKIANEMNRYKPIHCNFVTKNNYVNKIKPVKPPACNFSNVVLSLVRYQVMVSLLFPTAVNLFLSLVNNPHGGILFPRSSLCK